MKEVISQLYIILFAFLLGLCIPQNSSCQLDSLLAKELRLDNRNQEFDQDKLDIYAADDRFIYTEAKYEETKLQAMWRRFKMWLFRSIGKGLNSDLFQYVIIGLAALMLTWFLLKTDRYGIVRQKDGKEKRYVEELDIRVHENILQQKYEEAIESGSWREALRYAYLMSIKSLDAKNIIQWKEWKLSSDYQAELEGTAYHDEFAKLTSFFNFGWYGKRPLDVDMFGIIKTTYESLKNKIKLG